MMARRRWLPENVTSYPDRHGRTRYRYRKTGQPTYHFRNDPGTPAFLEELAAAKAGIMETPEKFAPFSYDALIASFYRTPKWQDMAASSQKTYRGIIERFRAKNGKVDVRHVKTATIDAKLATMVKTPAAANNLRKALARLHRHAIKQGWRTDNPVSATDAYASGKGHHTWTEAELAAFDARWPYGTKERLAKELLLNSALRRSDMLMVGKGHRKEGKLHLYHTKNDSGTVVPVGPDLTAALDAWDGGHMTYMVTKFGKPYTSTGFYNWFKRACVKAGLPHCCPHGLRKAVSRRLAESGATSLQGRAVTGHKTDREFAYYAEQANREEMADEAMANLNRKFAKPRAQTND